MSARNSAYTTIEMRVIDAFRKDSRLRDSRGWASRCAFVLCRPIGSIRAAANRMVKRGYWDRRNHYQSWEGHIDTLIELKRSGKTDEEIAILMGRTRPAVSRQLRRIKMRAKK